MLKELGLPVSLEQLEKQRMLEAKYLSEDVIPQIQAYVQTLVENLHKSFCLVVEYQYGTPVKVRIAEKTKIEVDVKRKKTRKSIAPSKNTSNVYSSSKILEEWKKILENIPGGNAFYKGTLTDPFHSLSKLLRVMQSKGMMKYTSSLFELLKLPTTGKITPPDFVNMLEPEQFIKETTKEGSINRIVVWSQSQKTEKLMDGTRIKIFEEDGVTPIMIDKTKKILEGKWTLKVLCDLIVQKGYFEKLHSAN